MLQYVSVKKYKHLNNLINLWNGEFRKTFPIKRSLYKKLILEDENLNKDASFVALYDNEPVGFIFIKTWLKDSGLLNESDKAHISLMFVKKEMRNMGIGSDMLKLSMSEIKKHRSISKIEVGNDIHCIFTGIPSEITSAPIFFVNKGFVQKDGVVDMIRVLRKDSISEQYDKKGLTIQIATEEEKDEILKLCVLNKWNKEAYLINQYYEKGGTGRRIALGIKDGKIVSLVRFNDKNDIAFKVGPFLKDKKLGSILFVKASKEFESEGYDDVMVQVARRYLVKRGCKKVIILATDNIKFYKQLGYSALRFYLNFEMDI